MAKPVLFNVPPSLFSQVARLALAEKGIDYENHYVIPGPSAYESYEPWYMRLNPQGTVPTLVHEGRVLPDSREILRYLEVRFPEDGLWLDRPEAGQIERWVEDLYAVSFRELSYGSPRLLKLGVWINGKRIENLRLRQQEYPQLGDIYAAKIKDIESFSSNAVDAGHMQRMRQEVAQKLDQIEQAVTDRACLAGTQYSMADLIWTVGVARLTMLGMKPCENRPALEAWYGRMKSRPSFTDAGIMERFQLSAMLRVMWSKLTKRITGRGTGYSKTARC